MAIPQILVLTDIANDYDDMMALLILGYFHKIGKIEIKGVIVTLDPVVTRARLAEGLFLKMGIHVPVATGTRGTDAKRETKKWDEAALNASFLSNTTSFPSHLALAGRVLREASEQGNKIRILAIASLRDLARSEERRVGKECPV